jgi:hypothetical protein
VKQWIESASTEIVTGDAPVKVFAFGSTGLGYYINPAPEGEVGSTGSVSVNGGPAQSFSIVHESDLHDWYKPIHLQSKRSLGVVFFSEKLVRRFVREIAPLLDWSGDVESLEKQEAWSTIGNVAREIRDRLYQ